MVDAEEEAGLAADDDQIDGEQLVSWPPSSWELVLRAPVEHKGSTYHSIQLREPTGGEWERIFAAPPALQRRTAISIVGAVPLEMTAMIGIGDLVQGEEYLHAFFQVGQVVGAFWPR